MGEIADFLIEQQLRRKVFSNRKMYRDDVVHVIVTRTLKNTTITKSQALRLMWDWFKAEGKKVGYEEYPKDTKNLRQVLQFTLDFQDHFKDYLRGLDK